MSKAAVASSSPGVLLARLTKLTSTIPGLDASFMLAQYSTPIVITLLLSLAKFRTTHPRLRMRFGGAKGDGAASLVKLADGLGKAAGSIGDARVIMRAFGLLPIIQYLLALHPRPLASLRSLLSFSHGSTALSSGKTLPTLQVLSLLAYYPLEHLAWLGSKGVVPISVQSMGMASLWSVRFWALYVLLEIYNLGGSYFALNSRTRALRAARPSVTPAEAEGYELQDSAASAEKDATLATTTKEARSLEVQSLKKDWVGWQNAVLVNSGYAPLTLHWSTPGGLWSNPLITASLGSVAAVGQLITNWQKTSA